MGYKLTEYIGVWAIAIFLLAVLPSYTSAQSDSVGALYAQGDGGSLNFNCTATAVERREGKIVILTAFHCATRGTSYLISFNRRTFYPLQLWKIPHEEIDAQRFPRTHNQPKTDMAMFVMEDDPRVTIIPIGDDAGLKPGQKIIMVGYPLGITKTHYEGIVAGRLEKPGADSHGYVVLQIFGAPGSSGTAVIDRETKTVVGVLTGGAQAIVGTPVLFATPISYRKYLMEVPRNK